MHDFDSIQQYLVDPCGTITLGIISRKPTLSDNNFEVFEFGGVVLEEEFMKSTMNLSLVRAFHMRLKRKRMLKECQRKGGKIFTSLFNQS